jgi:hypothetical protein
MTDAVQEVDTESALYAGAIATAVIALLPYINDFIVPCYAIGAAIAVWFAISKRAQSLTPKASAKLGFLSSFFGSMAAVVLVDIIWQFFDYQLWQKQNAQFMVAIFRLFASEATVSAVSDAMAQNATKSFAWYIVIFQLIGNAIMAGIFGTLAGLITRKVVANPSRTAI